MERPKPTAKKADWIAYADTLETSGGSGGSVDLDAKLAELEADARQYRKQISQLTRTLRGK